MSRLPGIRKITFVFLVFFPLCSLADTGSVPHVLNGLHQGRFDAAEARIAGFPDDTLAAKAEKSFLQAFATYWRVLYDPYDNRLRSRFEKQLLEAIRQGESYMERSPGDARASLFLGSAHLLRAQLRAAEKKVFPAAYEAKKSRKMLLRSLQASDSGPDSCFGLGTYEYYADQLPAVVKGLRFLLFIPGGDRELGLRRLERAADEGSLFRFEARVVLLTIYSGDKEHLHDDALRHAGLLLDEQDRSVTALHAAAKLYLGLARPERAASLLAEALALAEEDTDDDVMAALHYQAAQSEYQRFRPQAALVHLNWMLEPGRTVPEELGEDADDLVRRCRLMAVAGEGSALKRMLEGRELLVGGKPAEALRPLVVAAGSTSLPAEFRNRCRLMAGQAADLSGKRTQAQRWYREAGRHNAAALYRKRPFTIQDGF